MHIGSVQSHGSNLSVVSTRTAITISSSEQTTSSMGAKAGDLLELSNEIDPGFARSVIVETVEERLQAALADAGIDISANEILAGRATSVDYPVDNSPEATARRIVEFATSHLAAHKRNNPDLAAEQQVEEFAMLIKDAVETGFKEAGGLLSRLGQISGSVQADIDQTLDLVNKGIDDFAADALTELSEPALPADAEDPTRAI